MSPLPPALPSPPPGAHLPLPVLKNPFSGELLLPVVANARGQHGPSLSSGFRWCQCLKLAAAARVEQAQHRHFLPLADELTSHLVGDQTTHGKTADAVRAVRLQLPDLGDVMRRHLLERGDRTSFPVETHRLQTKHRLVRAEMSREIAKAKHVAADAMHAEERRSMSARLDRHQ